MDINKLRTLVFEKTSIKIDTNDPIFALVALNEAVLAECVEQHVEVMLQTTDTLSAQTAQLLEAGERYKTLLQQIAAVSATGATPEIAAVLAKADDKASGLRQAITAMDWRLWQLLAGAGGVALLSTLLTLGGLWAFSPAKPSMREAPKMVAPAVPALTAEQVQLMQNGEKYLKMWPKLDANTQAKIQKLIQQP